MTYTYPPAVAAYSGVSNDKTQVNWTHNGNTDGVTVYRVNKSTWNGFTGTVVSSDTYLTSAEYTELSTNTTYWYRVGSINGQENVNWVSFGSKVTLSTCPVSAAYTGVGKLELTANWTDNGNAGGTVYVVQKATWSGFTGTTVSSQTVNISVIYSALLPDTSHWCQVKTVNHENISSDWTYLGYTKTLTKSPGSITNLAATKYMRPGWIKLTWTAPGNDEYTGTATSYVLKYGLTAINTEAEFNAATTIPTNAPAAAGNTESLIVSGLSNNTLYNFAIKSIEEYGAVSAIDSVSPRANTYSGSTSEGFYVDETIGSDSAEGSETAPWLTLNKAVSTILTGDWIYVKAGNYNGSITIQNLGNPIVGIIDRKTAFIGTDRQNSKVNSSDNAFYIKMSSVVVSDLVFNTPMGTGIRISTGSTGIEIRRITSYGSQYGVVMDMGATSSIHYDTIIENNLFDNPSTMGLILRNSAGGITANKVTVKNNIFRNGNAMILSEGTSANDYDIKYNCFYNATVVGINISTSTDVALDPCFYDVGNHDYHLKSKTGRWDGSSWVRDIVHSPCIDKGDATDNVGAESSPNGSRIDIGIYGGTSEASKTYSNMEITVATATPPGPTSVDLQYTAGAVRYKIERSRNQIDWTNIVIWDTCLSSNTYKDTGVGPGTTYYYRVAAYNDMGAQDDLYSNILKVVTKPLMLALVYLENIINITIEDGIITIVIPANILGENYYYEAQSGRAPANVETMALPSNNGEILENGIVSVKLYKSSTGELVDEEFSKEVTIEIPYKDTDNDGIEDRSNIPVKRLTGYKYKDGVWTELDKNDIEIDKTSKKVKIKTKSFSVYGIGGIKYASTLDSLIVYPNPWKPGTSGIFSGNNMIFDNLTKDCRIRLFDLSGQMWLDKTIDGSYNGRYVWDGRSDCGENAGSGLYIYVVTNDNGEKKKGKVSIAR
ncbi:MAG: T9SS type A sorting domain-containing protein [Elusimicrobiota bacterium]